MKTIILLSTLFITITILGCKKDNNNSSDTNPNPNTSDTVKIGSQTWMKKNLDVSKYRNGDTIRYVPDSLQWGNLATGAWCYYNNDSTNGAIYGKLYNWAAVKDPRGLAPQGWHVPTDSEWIQLRTYLTDQTGSGCKMKALILWDSPNTCATNSSGFTALPGGFRYGVFGSSLTGTFEAKGRNAYWWSASYYTSFPSPNIAYFSLYHLAPELNPASSGGGFGMSVRCIRD